MPTLFHQPMSPPCRTVRLALAEKHVAAELVEQREWERDEAFLALNPAGDVPVLIGDDGTVVSGAFPITEYLEETCAAPPLIAGDAGERAEVRRLVDWFARKFASEVSDCLIYEKIVKRFLGVGAGGGPPDMTAVRAALHNVRYHLDYISYLMEAYNWLAGDTLSLADLTAAAHFSCLDYVGDVPWAQYPAAKEWYVRLKSRPSFRPLLADHVPGMPPPRAYANLDF